MERHISGVEHTKAAKVIKSTKSLKSLVGSDTMQESIIIAEVLFTGYILEHNLPFEAAAHAGPLFCKMFPDSTIAKRYGCATTKTAAIINYAMAPDMRKPVMKEQPLSLPVDVSSDTGTESMYPLVVRIFDVSRQEVSSKFWHVFGIRQQC